MGLDNPVHIIALLLFVLLIFGAKRLPDMGRSLGEGLRGFKDAVNTHVPSAPETKDAPVPALAAAPAPATAGEPVNSRDLTA
jgi:sec-independent protein translocase protein TatA